MMSASMIVVVPQGILHSLVRAGCNSTVRSSVPPRSLRRSDVLKVSLSRKPVMPRANWAPRAAPCLPSHSNKATSCGRTARISVPVVPHDQVNDDRNNDKDRDYPTQHLLHLISTAVDSPAVATSAVHVWVLGIELCLRRSILSTLLPQDSPTGSPRDTRRKVRFEDPASSSCVVDGRDQQDGQQSCHDPYRGHLGMVGDLSGMGKSSNLRAIGVRNRRTSASRRDIRRPHRLDAPRP